MHSRILYKFYWVDFEVSKSHILIEGWHNEMTILCCNDKIKNNMQNYYKMQNNMHDMH